MQIGEGEGDAGTAWLERSGGSYLSRHTDANNNAHGSHDWNVCIVYWGRVFGKSLDEPKEEYDPLPIFKTKRLVWHAGGTLKNHVVLFDNAETFKAERSETTFDWRYATQIDEWRVIMVANGSKECKMITWDS